MHQNAVWQLTDSVPLVSPPFLPLCFFTTYRYLNQENYTNILALDHADIIISIKYSTNNFFFIRVGIKDRYLMRPAPILLSPEIKLP